MVVFTDRLLEGPAAFILGTADFVVSSVPSPKMEAAAASLRFDNASNLDLLLGDNRRCCAFRLVLFAGEAGGGAALSALPPSKNSKQERWRIFFLDRGGGAADVVDAAADVAGAVDGAVDQDGCHMERGVMVAEARFNVASSAPL